jgi:hypothetical protein
VLGGVTFAGGVTWPERVLVYAALALVAAWQFVPLWEELTPPRHYAIPLLAGYLTLLAALLAALPDRLVGPLLVGLLTTAAAAVALLIAIAVSLKYGQVGAAAAAALAGCWLFAMPVRPTRGDCEGPPAARGLVPVYAILVGGPGVRRHH